MSILEGISVDDLDDGLDSHSDYTSVFKGSSPELVSDASQEDEIAGLRQNIYDMLYDETSGLPASKYDDNTLMAKTDELFQFFDSRFSNAAVANRLS